MQNESKGIQNRPKTARNRIEHDRKTVQKRPENSRKRDMYNWVHVQVPTVTWSANCFPKHCVCRQRHLPIEKKWLHSSRNHHLFFKWNSPFWLKHFSSRYQCVGRFIAYSSFYNKIVSDKKIINKISVNKLKKLFDFSYHTKRINIIFKRSLKN